MSNCWTKWWKESNELQDSAALKALLEAADKKLKQASEDQTKGKGKREMQICSIFNVTVYFSKSWRQKDSEFSGRRNTGRLKDSEF